MDDRLTTIIEDLYRLDPTLKGEDEAVRALVATLLKEKPIVVPDPAFVMKLRSELVVPSAGAVRPGSVASPWWMVYAAPVGALALLLLILVPKYVTSPTETTFTPTLAPTPVTNEEVADESVPDAASFQMSAPADMGTRKMGGAEGDAAFGSEMSIMAAPALDVPAGPSLFAPDQVAGGEILAQVFSPTLPTILVVYKETEVLGVSQLIVPTEQPLEVSVPLYTRAVAGDVLTLQLYADNGDGIFTPEVDALVYDDFGVPLMTTLQVVR
jgi:hypothetical protein